MNQKPPQRKQPEPKDVAVGDELYVHHGGQPHTCRVVAHGRHGVTGEIEGAHHRFTWDKVLGHKSRRMLRYAIADKGEDGLILEDDDGNRRFIATPNESKEDPMVVKAFGGRQVALFLKSVAPGAAPTGAAPRPGLVQKKITDRTGRHQTKWVRSQKDMPKERRRAAPEEPAATTKPPHAAGDEVEFSAGEFHGSGHIVGEPGADGAHIKDASGRVHQVRWSEVTGKSATPAHHATPRAAVHERDIVNPIDPKASPEEKLAHIKKLTAENIGIVDDFIKKLDGELGSKSGYNIKSDESILAKANRPIIKAAKPWFGIEHIRDTFRFKTVISDVASLETVVKHLADLGVEVVKVDLDKMFKPKEWGWRIAAFDLRMPNGQLVEYYLPLKELEVAKKATGHKLFEAGRTLDPVNGTPEEIEKIATLQKQSSDLYEKAFRAYQARTGSDDSADRASLARTSAAAASLTDDHSSSKSPMVKAGAGFQTPSDLMAENLSSELKTRTVSGEPSITNTRSDISITSEDILPSSSSMIKTERGILLLLKGRTK